MILFFFAFLPAEVWVISFLTMHALEQRLESFLLQDPIPDTDEWNQERGDHRNPLKLSEVPLTQEALEAFHVCFDLHWEPLFHLVMLWLCSTGDSLQKIFNVQYWKLEYK